MKITWGTIKPWQQKGTLGPVGPKKRKQLYKLTDTVRQTYVELENNSNIMILCSFSVQWNNVAVMFQFNVSLPHCIGKFVKFVFSFLGLLVLVYLFAVTVLLFPHIKFVYSAFSNISYSEYPCVSTFWSLMCFVSLSVGITISYLKITTLNCQQQKYIGACGCNLFLYDANNSLHHFPIFNKEVSNR